MYRSIHITIYVTIYVTIHIHVSRIDTKDDLIHISIHVWIRAFTGSSAVSGNPYNESPLWNNFSPTSLSVVRIPGIIEQGKTIARTFLFDRDNAKDPQKNRQASERMTISNPLQPRLAHNQCNRIFPSALSPLVSPYLIEANF